MSRKGWREVKGTLLGLIGMSALWASGYMAAGPMADSFAALFASLIGGLLLGYGERFRNTPVEEDDSSEEEGS